MKGRGTTAGVLLTGLLAMGATRTTAAQEIAGGAAAETTSPPAIKRRAPRYKKQVKKGPVVPALGGGWTPEAGKALAALAARLGNLSESYSPQSPPVAVFSLEGGLIAGHPGEAAFHRLVSNADLAFGKELWDLVPPPFGERARVAHGRFRSLPKTVWAADPDYQVYRKALLEAYRSICRTQGGRRCRAWLVSMLRGLSEADVADFMQQSVEEELQATRRVEKVAASAGDPAPVELGLGLRRVPDMAALVGLLRRHGFDLWVLSASNQWVAEEVASRYGFDKSRVVGVRSRILNRVFQEEVLDPIPEGVGRAEAVTALIGRDPDLVVGVGADDKPLLGYGKGLRIALPSPEDDDDWRRWARSRGWLLHPALPEGPPEAPR